MTNDEKYTKVAQALQTLKNSHSGRIAPETKVADICRAVRSTDALNAVLHNISVDDMVKLFDLIAEDAVKAAYDKGLNAGNRSGSEFPNRGN